jgi:hypothetical protein
MLGLQTLAIAGLLLLAAVSSLGAAPAASNAGESAGKAAKRMGPAPVAAVQTDGLVIEVAPWTQGCGLGQNGGFIVARDAASGEPRWLLQVYATDYDPRRERDVQDVFITALRLLADGETLQVEDELGRRFRVDLSRRALLSE